MLNVARKRVLTVTVTGYCSHNGCSTTSLTTQQGSLETPSRDKGFLLSTYADAHPPLMTSCGLIRVAVHCGKLYVVGGIDLYGSVKFKSECCVRACCALRVVLMCMLSVVVQTA